MPKIYIILLILIFNLIRHTSQLTFQKTTIPQCAISQHYNPNERPKIAVISHDSAISTFAQNPEQGARDAAAILDVQIDWNRHFINSASKMIADIRDAVDNVRKKTPWNLKLIGLISWIVESSRHHCYHSKQGCARGSGVCRITSYTCYCIQRRPCVCWKTRTHSSDDWQFWNGKIHCQRVDE